MCAWCFTHLKVAELAVLCFHKLPFIHVLQGTQPGTEHSSVVEEPPRPPRGFSQPSSAPGQGWNLYLIIIIFFPLCIRLALALCVLLLEGFVKGVDGEVVNVSVLKGKLGFSISHRRKVNFGLGDTASCTGQHQTEVWISPSPL